MNLGERDEADHTMNTNETMKETIRWR